ncbi:MAG: hypothetical protein K0Q46_929 [Rhodococcus erythropolis]|jgi:hypothetical protein|nr:hypothetical protein [Rhodococcus erythropolis]
MNVECEVDCCVPLAGAVRTIHGPLVTAARESCVPATRVLGVRAHRRFRLVLAEVLIGDSSPVQRSAQGSRVRRVG